ncbi:unnamed protein product [Urochloa decumbens]|uniref:NB-ARC domain-containing protein n=1 Tax=Urochloa decumbens TaxID=240449 RepID=A0ABC9F0J0_9POAL
MAMMFFSAILSDLTSRSISFLIDKYCSRPTAAATLEATLQNSLKMLLLRVHVVVEEAEQRHITNQALLRDLNLIRKEMYIGCHALDIFVCRYHRETARDQQDVSPSSSTPSRFNPAKRLCFRGGSGSSEQDRLFEVFGRLEATIRDASELFVLLSGCPRRCRQPYSMYLLLDNCMFSRQMEMERLMEFLLQEDASSSGDSGAETLAVLPVIGPGRVGKTTIIEHACNDERARSHFSQIMRFSQDSIRDVKTIATLGDCSVIKLHNRAVGGERTLVIIELTGDIDEHVWAKLYSDCTHQFAIGSKIIVASRSDKIANLGTTQPLTVQSFAEEAYWYFFKARTFGSADVKDHPKVASITMDLAREMTGCFFSASVFNFGTKQGLRRPFLEHGSWNCQRVQAQESLAFRCGLCRPLAGC